MCFILYHTQNRRGTTATSEEYTAIIPHTKPAGNYNKTESEETASKIMPHTEPTGNYNYNDVLLRLCANYITHRTVRELQQVLNSIQITRQLYHTQNRQGTTTIQKLTGLYKTLYHTQNQQKATTPK